MRAQLFKRIYKAILVVTRISTKPMAMRLRFASMAYYWADLHLYDLNDIYVLPVCFYRFLSWLCNVIASANTIDYRNLHSRQLQKFVNWLIHRVPTNIRYS